MRAKITKHGKEYAVIELKRNIAAKKKMPGFAARRLAFDANQALLAKKAGGKTNLK